MDKPHIEVAAAVLFHSGKLLITQRRPNDHLGGLWEFPGGKREANETFSECLKRELREELGIEVQPEAEIHAVIHEYPAKTVHLRFLRCRWLQGEVRALDCQAFAWVARSELDQFEFPPADAALLAKLRSGELKWVEA